jgi:(E)-4-hydroxy-3-methylbut-2-enyl-diphosphate synthase
MERHFPLFCGEEFFNTSETHSILNFVAIDFDSLTENLISKINSTENIVLVLDSFLDFPMQEQRSVFFKFILEKCKAPVVIKNNYKSLSETQLQLYSSTDFGALLLDGFGDGMWIKTIDCGTPVSNNRLAFGILQAARTRVSKTEYISCPSCGRTLFDLQETTAKIREKTDHLKGIKIGIMGCIVNGPGEMADADYGYVGVGVDKITLYKGKEVIQKNVPSKDAVDSLIELIKEHGDWIDKEKIT